MFCINLVICSSVILYSLVSRKALGVMLQFSTQQVVKYFTYRGSCVYLSALDANKVFDRIDHSKLIDNLSERNLTAFVINTIANWCCKLCSVVRWNSMDSCQFSVSCVVRQGGILYALLLNIYIDD